jgi:asparagine synthase (glutamine-hydrolysing)
MCGIAGIVDLLHREIPESELLELRDSITHRGPDDAGIFRAPGVGLAARRLSILDLSPRGHMPMANEDESLWITYNGEIYNFLELRADLEGLGHRFHSGGDTEVVLHSFEQWGDSCVDRFRGMFAFAIWDAERKTLFAARDRLGVKPLFYASVDQRLIFSSEIHGLYRFVQPDAGRIDPLSLDFYLSHGYVPPDRCFVRGLEKLPPGHTLRLDGGRITTHRYWRPRYRPTLKMSLEESLDAIDRELSAAVARRLRSDVPLGSLLSGGIDSGLVTSMAAMASSQQLKTFSVGFEGAEPGEDERPLARLVAERYDTDHTELVVGPGHKSVLPRMLWHLGEPFADVGILPMREISALAKCDVTVVLSGDGGDESFAGYPSIRSAQLAGMLRSAVPAAPRRALAAALVLPIVSSVPGASRAHGWLENYVNCSPAERFEAVGLWGDWRSRLYTREARSALHGSCAQELVDDVLEAADASLSAGELQLFGELELRLSRYLTKVDIASSSASLEVRSPFLDHGVVELAACLPLSQKLVGGRPKGLLRRLASRYLPEELLTQPKRGFAPRLGGWLRGEWSGLLRELTGGPGSASATWIEEPVLREVVDAHLSGAADHADRLYAILCLEIWWRLFVSRTMSRDDVL